LQHKYGYIRDEPRQVFMSCGTVTTNRLLQWFTYCGRFGVYPCVWKITFEPNVLRPSHSAWWFNWTPSGSSPQIKVTGHERKHVAKVVYLAAR